MSRALQWLNVSYSMVLGRHRWSSYRAYIGLEKAPEWLECAEVLALGGGRRVCGMKWEELARAVGLKDYASAAMAVRRYERRLRRDRNQKKYLAEVTEMLNVKM